MTIGDPDDTQQYLWCVGREWKLIQRFHGKDTTKYKNVHMWDTANARLFNMRSDPHETNDLADERPELVKRMKLTIADWRHQQASK